MHTHLRSFAKFAAPIVLSGSVAIGVAGPANAVTPAYSSDLTTLQNQCLAYGEMHSPVSGDGGVLIPTTQVSYGSTGVCVALVQTLLNDGGEYFLCNNGQELGVDGQDGPITTAVVKCVQSREGLQVDGQVGPITWSHIWFVN